MGLFNGGLIGKILRDISNDPVRNAARDAAKEWRDSYTKPQPRSSVTWECKFCGMKFRGGNRPGVKSGGRCPNSPYGTHSWIGY